MKIQIIYPGFFSVFSAAIVPTYFQIHFVFFLNFSIPSTCQFLWLEILVYFWTSPIRSYWYFNNDYFIWKLQHNVSIEVPSSKYRLGNGYTNHKNFFMIYEHESELLIINLRIFLWIYEHRKESELIINQISNLRLLICMK